MQGDWIWGTNDCLDKSSLEEIMYSTRTHNHSLEPVHYNIYVYIFRSANRRIWGVGVGAGVQVPVWRLEVWESEAGGLEVWESESGARSSDAFRSLLHSVPFFYGFYMKPQRRNQSHPHPSASGSAENGVMQ